MTQLTNASGKTSETDANFLLSVIKTDVKDSEWIADLVRHGLIAKSFVPPRPLRELREQLALPPQAGQGAERNRLL